MANTPPVADPVEPLKFKTWVLTVFIHCEGCKKKVKKVLQSIEGVYRTEVDSQQHKAVVTGSVDVETLIKKLRKHGKHAEVCPDDATSHSDNIEEKKSPVKSKKNKNQQDHSTIDSVEKGGADADADHVKGVAADEIMKDSAKEDIRGNDNSDASLKKKKQHPAAQKSPADKVAAGNHSPAAVEKISGAAATDADHQPTAGNEGKSKKKNKQQNGEGPDGAVVRPGVGDNAPPVAAGGAMASGAELISAATPTIPYQRFANYHPEVPEYGLSYNTAYPGGANSSSYFAPPMHTYEYFDPEYSRPPPPPPDPIRAYNDQNDYYEDEEESGCSIM